MRGGSLHRGVADADHHLGEVCTCPSRALIQEDIYDEFMTRCLDRIAAIRQGDPLDTETTVPGAV